VDDLALSTGPISLTDGTARRGIDSTRRPSSTSRPPEGGFTGELLRSRRGLPQVDDDPAFVLGAMAPDLLPLCGAVADAETSPKVAASLVHHQSVDVRFPRARLHGAAQGRHRARVHP
jgi:hypothetical protein